MAKNNSIDVIVEYVDTTNKSSVADFKQGISELSKALDKVGANSISVPFQAGQVEPVVMDFELSKALPKDTAILDKLTDTTVTLVETRNRIKANSVSNATVVKKVPFVTGLELMAREAFGGYVDEHGSVSNMTGTVQLDAVEKSLTIKVDSKDHKKTFPPKTFR